MAKMKAVIKSTKHFNQFSPTTVLVTSISNFDVLEAVAVPDISTAIEVEEGSLVKQVYLEVWLTSEITETTGAFQLTLEKVPAGATPMTFAQSNSLGSYPNKKNVFYTTRGLSPNSTANPVPIVRGWFSVPKGKQRMGLGDKVIMNITAITNPLTWCGFMLYKEYK